jgi:hypothetical protein
VTLVQCLAASKRLAWTIFSYLFDPNPTDVTTVMQLNTLLESDYALFVYMTCKKASRINVINKKERQKAAGKDEEEIEQKLGSNDESSKRVLNCTNIINNSIHSSSSSTMATTAYIIIIINNDNDTIHTSSSTMTATLYCGYRGKKHKNKEHKWVQCVYLCRPSCVENM